ncbi:hypothetical protein ACWGH7_16665 [Streptomyces cyaneofuscatus]
MSDLRRQLLAIAREVPPGVFRIYSSPSGTEEIVVLPSLQRLHPDRFEVVTHDSIRELHEAPEGEAVPFVFTAYAVNTIAPVVWRIQSADMVCGAGTEEGATVAPSEAASPSWAASWKALRLDARTGAMTPTREELQKLIWSIKNAEHSRDMPRRGASQ